MMTLRRVDSGLLLTSCQVFGVARRPGNGLCRAPYTYKLASCAMASNFSLIRLMFFVGKDGLGVG